MSSVRLTLIAPNLSGGGAERTLARLATHWAEQGCEVTVITLAAVSTDDFPVPPTVRRIGLGLTDVSRGVVGAIRSNLRRIAAIREAFHELRPDVVISFIEQANVLALLAARPLGLPVVISERTDPSRHEAGRAWDVLRRQVYRRCETLVVLSDEIASQMRPITRGQPVVVIPNGIAAGTGDDFAGQDCELMIVGVGRLDAAKGYDRLIEAFSLIAAQHAEWRLVIVGEGPQRTSLEAQVADLDLVGRVELVGRMADPSVVLKRASIFALPSRYEGFPNALLEAMASGVPAVAFNGPAAVREIIRDGIDGLLVPDGDVAGLASALAELMRDGDRRQAMGSAARDVADRFSLSAFYQHWDEVIGSAANRKIMQPTSQILE